MRDRWVIHRRHRDLDQRRVAQSFWVTHLVAERVIAVVLRIRCVDKLTRLWIEAAYPPMCRVAHNREPEWIPVRIGPGKCDREFRVLIGDQRLRCRLWRVVDRRYYQPNRRAITRAARVTHLVGQSIFSVVVGIGSVYSFPGCWVETRYLPVNRTSEQRILQRILVDVASGERERCLCIFRQLQLCRISHRRVVYRGYRDLDSRGAARAERIAHLEYEAFLTVEIRIRSVDQFTRCRIEPLDLTVARLGQNAVVKCVTVRIVSYKNNLNGCVFLCGYSLACRRWRIVYRCDVDRYRRRVTRAVHVAYLIGKSIRAIKISVWKIRDRAGRWIDCRCPMSWSGGYDNCAQVEIAICIAVVRGDVDR